MTRRRSLDRICAAQAWPSVLFVPAAVAILWTVSGPAVANSLGGSIAGVVTTREAVPRPIRVTVDPEVCGQTLPDESIVTDAAGHVSGAVLFVAGVKAPAPAETAVVNEKCRFGPRVSLLKPNGVVRMTSKDAVLHTMHASGAGGKAMFNLSLPIPDMTLSRPVDRPGLVTLSCSTHPWMRGYVYVTEDVSAVSMPNGAFRLDGVPAGAHVLQVWHETLKAAPASVVVKDGETVTIDVVLVK